MEYVPETTTGECAGCGEAIFYNPSPEEDFPWLTETDRYCYEESPHVPTFDIVVTRAGSSNRTADELAAVFIIDVAELAGMTDDGGITEDQPENLKEDYTLACTVEGWCDDPDNSQALSDAVRDWESILCDAGYSVDWDDGYSIYRVAE